MGRCSAPRPVHADRLISDALELTARAGSGRSAVVLRVPQLSPYVGSLAAHLENEQVILAECRRLAGPWPLVSAT
ncbi:hypothetical protein [Streptomyces litchfieldiae]|uniref:Uncharacterized protein n=1 Tax=Streptomyces litchfieldiae TaxID=3075543 RepID=A0ABU2MK90_9ACTN|nr:hypothetical protein [Streptomyces sp. DSM 44938]MDT0341862.1 hypothetical protein [Streptomyces sp. DSM 44938]